MGPNTGSIEQPSGAGSDGREELFVRRRLTPGDDQQYNEAFQERLAFEVFKLKLGLAIVILMFAVVAIIAVFSRGCGN